MYKIINILMMAFVISSTAKTQNDTSYEIRQIGGGGLLSLINKDIRNDLSWYVITNGTKIHPASLVLCLRDNSELVLLSEEKTIRIPPRSLFYVKDYFSSDKIIYATNVVSRPYYAPIVWNRQESLVNLQAGQVYVIDMIGIYAEVNKAGELIVDDLDYWSPAKKAGIKPGFKIRTINDIVVKPDLYRLFTHVALNDGNVKIQCGNNDVAEEYIIKPEKVYRMEIESDFIRPYQNKYLKRWFWF